MSGIIGMITGIDHVADGWRVEMADGQGRLSRAADSVEVLPAAWE